MLLGCTEFTKLYLRIKDDPWPFVNLFKLVLDAGMDEVEVLELLNIANGSLPSVRLKYDALKAKLSSLEANVQRSEITLQEISNHTSKESKTLEQYRSIYNQLKEETENLNNKKARLENIIDSIQGNNETYAKIRQMIKHEIESIISNPRRLLQFALASIFESSRKHPGRLHAIYYNMPTIKTVKRSSSETLTGDIQDNQHQQYLCNYASDYATSEKMLLEEAEHLYDKMIAETMSHQTTEEIQNTNSDHTENGLPIIKVEYEKNVG